MISCPVAKPEPMINAMYAPAYLTTLSQSVFCFIVSLLSFVAHSIAHSASQVLFRFSSQICPKKGQPADCPSFGTICVSFFVSER